MNNFSVITDPELLESVIRPLIEANGAEFPGRGNYWAAIERDSAGQIVGYQLIQVAVFLEGMWSDGGANILRLHKVAAEYVEKSMKVPIMLTMTANDDRGQKICRIACAREGFEKLPVTVLRRVFECQH